jgi:hypothetical protein
MSELIEFRTVTNESGENWQSTNSAFESFGGQSTSRTTPRMSARAIGIVRMLDNQMN